MRALVYTAAETLAMREMPDPVADEAAGDVLVRIDSVGICGSDMHAWLGHDERRPAPLILGHEAAGVVTGGKHDGRRVTVNPLVTCGACPACLAGRENLCAHRQIISMPPREGAFAPYLVMPERNVVTVPDHVTLAQAALAEPIAVGWHGVALAARHLSRPLAEARALVIGGGAIGVGVALSLQCAGIGTALVVEPNALRRDWLDAHGELQVCAPETLPGDGFDLVIDAVGLAATRAQAVARVLPGGVIVHLGLGDAAGEMDVRRMTLQEIAFVGGYTYTRQNFIDTAQAMFDGRLGRLDWTDSRPLDAGAEAFTAIRAGRVAVPKIILTP